jgi:hypothetical protein
MKNILKAICSAIILTGVISCEDTKDPNVSPNGFELRKDGTVTSPSVLTQATATVPIMDQPQFQVILYKYLIIMIPPYLILLNILVTVW